MYKFVTAVPYLEETRDALIYVYVQHTILVWDAWNLQNTRGGQLSNYWGCWNFLLGILHSNPSNNPPPCPADLFSDIYTKNCKIIFLKVIRIINSVYFSLRDIKCLVLLFAQSLTTLSKFIKILWLRGSLTRWIPKVDRKLSLV